MDAAAELLQDLPKDFHYIFDTVHFILCIQGDRDDYGDSFGTATRTNPFASWMSAMMSCFAGGLLVGPLCGEPVLGAWNDNLKVLLATVLWFLLFYSPQDICYQVSKMFPVKMMMYITKGIYYPKKIYAGMKHASHVMPGNILAMVIIAVCKGNGSGMIKPVCRLVRGVWRPLSSEFLAPSVTTKYCIMCCLMLHLLPGPMTYVIVAGLLLSMKVGPLLGVPVDIFTPLERSVAPLVIGTNEQPAEKKSQ